MIDRAHGRARGRCPLAELGLQLVHLGPDLLADGLAQVVRLRGRETPDPFGDLHQLLLVDGHSIGGAEDGFQPIVLVPYAAWIALVARILRDVLHGTRPVQGHQRDEIVEQRGPDIPERFTHSARLELKHAFRVALGEHAVGGRIIQRDGLDVEVGMPFGPDDSHRAVDDVEVAQPEEVHLQKAKLLHVAHGHLRDHLGVAFLHERQVLGERTFGDDHPGGVDGVLADEALERPGHVHDLAHLLVAVVGRPQLALGVGQARIERDVEHFGHEFGDAIGLAVGHVHDPGGVANGLPGLDGAERGYLGHPIATVLVGHVVDDSLAAGHREVDVDVGHADAVGIEEPLEQQIVRDRVEVGDAQQVRHQRAGGRTTARPHRYAILLREADEIPHDEEVRREAHLLHHRQLGLEALPDGRCDLGTVAALQALLALLAQIGGFVVPLGHREVRDEHVVELDVHIAALGDLERCRHGLGMLGEGVQHLPLALEEELLRAEAHPILFGEPGTGLNAEQHVVRGGVGLAQVVDVVGGHQLEARLRSHLHQPRIDLGQLGDARLLHLEVDVLPAEHVHQALDLGFGGSHLTVLKRTGQPAAGAARETDEPFGMLAQDAVVHARLVVVALEEGHAAQLEQVAVALIVARKQCQVPALFVLPFFAKAVLHHIGLEPDDRLDARGPALQVELDDAGEDPVVGDGEGRHAQLRGPGDELLHLAGAVERGVVGMDVQMTEPSGRAYRLWLHLITHNGFGRN